MKTASLAVFAGLIFNVLATYSVITKSLCSTFVTTKSTSPVKTLGIKLSQTTTKTIKQTVTPRSTVTPPATTSTITVIATSIVSTTLSQITDTYTDTSTIFETSTSTETDTETETTTTTFYSTTTSTSTIAASAGYTPINPGALKRGVDRPDARRLARRAQSVPLCPAKSGAKIYPKSVICGTLVIYSTQVTSTKTASTTVTTTIATPTSSVTATSTSTSTTTITQVDAETTTTVSTTLQVSTTVTTTTTSTSTLSTTATVGATATYYAACGPQNLYTTDFNDVRIGYNGEVQTDNFNFNSAYDCCVSCLTAPTGTCAVSMFFSSFSVCRYFNNGRCSFGNVAGSFRSPGLGGATLILSNSYCGIFQSQ